MTHSLTDDQVFRQHEQLVEQPRPVEDLVRESGGAPNNAPIAQVTGGVDPDVVDVASPSLDPVPSAPPPAPTPPGPPAADPAPAAQPEPEVLPAEQPTEGADWSDAEIKPSAELAVPESNVEIEVWTNDEPWEHDKIDFRGDSLNVRRPTNQALAGLSLSASRFIKMSTRNDITALFIARHLSPRSYDRVFSRLMDPDDHEYTVETIAELMQALVGDR
jgi:hypothetical protein